MKIFKSMAVTILNNPGLFNWAKVFKRNKKSYYLIVLLNIFFGIKFFSALG